MGEWETKRNLPKSILREELAATLHCHIPADRPVIAFFDDALCHPSQIEKGINELSKWATVIVKMFNPINFAKEVIIWPSKGYAANLLRFTADYVFTGYFSGTLVSSLMLGLNVIPYHTRMVRGSLTREKITNYQTLLAQHLNNPLIPSCQCLRQLGGTSYDLEDTQGLISHIQNATYWADYHQRLPQMQQAVFGDYTIEGAAQKTAMLAMRAFIKGSFGEYTEAIQLNHDAINKMQK